MVKLTILGSCRQYKLKELYETSKIQESIAYPHYTKEVLEVIKFCKYGDTHISSDETRYIFRSAILNNSNIQWNEEIYNDFMSSDIFAIEIASKICYKIGEHYAHHIALENNNYNKNILNLIDKLPKNIYKQNKDEIENDIVEIIKELPNKKIIIISHICTYDSGERYILTQWLKEICEKYNIPFLNPVTEFRKLNLNLEQLFQKESVISHYTNYGEIIIKNIYKNFFDKVLKN